MSCSCNSKNGDKNIFLPKAAEVVSAQMITATEKHLTLRMKDGSEFAYEPGQIVEAGAFGYGEIPLGLASSPTQKGTFELVVRVVGKVSKALGNLKAGDTMTIRGPLGKGFPVKDFMGNDVLIVAGGIGLCPTRSMIRYILDRRNDFGKFTLFFGARSPGEMLFLDDLADWRCSTAVDYHETVDRPDDKWMGNVGVITTLFKKAGGFSPNTRVIICGPPVMYKFVVRELDNAGIPRSNIYVDLERRMKCGVGKCGHCQINDKYVCMDGPVFRFSDIQNLEEAI
jgi:sulfhydrogenase subunit gamma (sulfur reductase)